jgi:hypothetical protein
MCALLALVSLSFGALAAAKFSITATINNEDTSNNAFTLQSDGSTSAVYTTGSRVDSGLTPTVGTPLYSQWGLNLSSSSRSFYLTLKPLNGSPDLFSGQRLAFNGQLFSRCFTSTGALQNWTQIQFADATCGMRVDFTFNRVNYSLVMSPTTAGTGSATVTCTKFSTISQSCSAWTDVPTPGIMNANVATLFGSGGAVVGQYFLSFNISLTHP